MTLTHAQLLDAVRAAGRDRESFTCADVRQQLGLATQDRKQLNRFYSLFRALQKDAATNPIEKLGSNCYRLRAASAEPATAAEPVLTTEHIQSDAAAVVMLEDAVAASALLPEPELALADQVPAPAACALAHSPQLGPIAQVSKPRGPWLSWLSRLSLVARFFSRRASRKSDAMPGIVMGA